MNIFALDRNPVLSAEYMCDKHIVKMVLESAQLLSTCHHYYNSNKRVYKSAYKNHPCSVWVRESVMNYLWLFEHFEALSYQYKLRYHKIHKSYILLYDKLIDPPDGMPDIGLIDFRQCMPEIYKTEDSVLAYRSYYIGEKLRFASWTEPSRIPYWINAYGSCIYKNIIKKNWLEECFAEEGVIIV
jgi:hypothetical protein